MVNSQVRAFISQTLVKRLELLPADETKAILTAAGNLTSLAQLTSLGWAPLTLHLALLDAALDQLGPARFRQVCCEMVVEILRRPPMSGLVETAIRLLGLSPMALAKLSPRGWALSFRDTGSLRFVGSDGPGLAAVALEELPRGVFRPSVLESMRGTFLSFLMLTRVEGTVQARTDHLVHGGIIFDLSWRETK